jgi:hypothetical protein
LSANTKLDSFAAYSVQSRTLGKHQKSAAGFIDHVVAMNCATEAGLALKKRIEKNGDKLFTFLHYDGMPWNNNNAEHAVRAFTRLRNAIGTSTPKGTREYATLLSVQQTLRYRGMSFLEWRSMAERTTEPQRFWSAGQFLVLGCCDRAVPVDYLPSQPRADIVATSAWGHDRL